MPFMVFLLTFLLSADVHAQSDKTTKLFEWRTSKTGDILLWLKQNEKLLNYADGCSLTASWRDDESELGTSVFNIAEILIAPENEKVATLFQLPEYGIGARVGVRYLPLASKNSWAIQIALAFEGAAEDVFDESSSSEAETMRESNWKYLSVAKDIRTGKRIYNFHFGCQNGKTYMKFLRK